MMFKLFWETKRGLIDGRWRYAIGELAEAIADGRDQEIVHCVGTCFGGDYRRDAVRNVQHRVAEPAECVERGVADVVCGNMDGEGAAAIRRIESGTELDQEWRESFAIFMAQQITRTPVFRDLTIRNYRAMGEEFLRIGFTEVERARQFLERYRDQTGDPADGVTAESMVEAVVGGHLKVTVDEGPFLRHMLTQIEFLARWIASFDWEIVRSPKDTGFILCDYPFVVVPAQAHPEAIGLGFREAVKYFPLTKTLCLRMGDQGYGCSYLKTSKEAVRIINQNVAVNSERFIMGPSREQLEHVIARSNTTTTDSVPRTVVEAIQSDRDSALYQFNFWPRRRYFYPKS